LTDKFIIGIVGSPFGVKGFVKVRSLSGEIDHLLNLQSVVVSKDSKERLLKIEESTSNSGIVLIRFQGIDTPEVAKTLNGAQLIVDRTQATPLNDDEFYIEDLKGLEVYVNNNDISSLDPSSNLRALRTFGSMPSCDEFAIIGCIIDIIEGGGGELVEVKLTNGEKKLIPLRKEFFPDINPAKGKILLQNLWIIGD